jgi:hypothetical protein
MIFSSKELLLDEAEDLARVLSLEEKVKVPYGRFDDCLETTEISGAEPDTLEFKFYVAGVGLVFINDVSGNQKDSLVNIITE